MTTPRIEKMVEKYKTPCDTCKSGWGVELDIEVFKKALTQAYQAGIDEAVEKFRQMLVELHNNKHSELHGGYDDADFLTAYCFFLQEAMQRLESLQDNK